MRWLLLFRTIKQIMEKLFSRTGIPTISVTQSTENSINSYSIQMINYTQENICTHTSNASLALLASRGVNGQGNCLGRTDNQNWDFILSIRLASQYSQYIKMFE